jgi:molecular chaperone IbpA
MNLITKTKFSQRGEKTLHDKLFNEFFSHTIGLDRLFKQLVRTNQVNSNFPPYNIVEVTGGTLVEIALAGYSKEDISVVVEEGVLSIEGEGKKDDQATHIHKGIATRKFKRSFRLGEYVEVKSADFSNGLLTVTLEEIIPEEKKPKVIDIN